eukprot:5360418-Amphidinium_carterae.1
MSLLHARVRACVWFLSNSSGGGQRSKLDTEKHMTDKKPSRKFQPDGAGPNRPIVGVRLLSSKHVKPLITVPCQHNLTHQNLPRSPNREG